jgi:hypothetical protein
VKRSNATLLGLATMLLAMGCALMLILDVVIGRGPASTLTAGVISWFMIFWYAIPML